MAGSGALAQQVAHFKQQLRAQRQQVAANREREKEEREWESAQLHKMHAIKAVVEERRRETEAVKRGLRLQLTASRPHSGGGSGGNHSHHSNTGSSFFSVFSSKDSSSQPPPGRSPVSSAPPAQLPLDEAIARARKSLKETQVTLEKQTLIVDSVDMNGHPSTLHAQRADNGPLPLSTATLSSVKAIRKDTVQLIQSHLSHVDELERHIDALDACLAFLDQHIAPNIQRPNTDTTAAPRNVRQQHSASSSGPMR